MLNQYILIAEATEFYIIAAKTRKLKVEG